MRAARLLQMLLLLQNRGRMNSAELAEELEVARRTILRDVDAMTEAGLPIIVHQGNQGGIELGFNYRTRLTGLAADEAEAMGIILSAPIPQLEQLGLERAASTARRKLLESFPDKVREKANAARQCFRIESVDEKPVDPRIPALAKAIKDTKIVVLRSRSSRPKTVHPTALTFGKNDCALLDAKDERTAISISKWGDINISNKSYDQSISKS